PAGRPDGACGRSSVLPDAPFRGAGGAEDQAVVRLHDVDDPVDALLDEQLEPVALNRLVTRARLVGELETDTVVAPKEADVRIGVEPPSRLVGAPEDVARPVAELDHGVDATSRPSSGPEVFRRRRASEAKPATRATTAV